MGQGKLKRIRNAAKKGARKEALGVARDQLLEIMRSPLKVRLMFCLAILFPKLFVKPVAYSIKREYHAHGIGEGEKRDKIDNEGRAV